MSLPAASSAAELKVQGMTCGNCARKVTTAVQALPGIHSATADPVTGKLTVRWNADAKPDAAAVIAAITAAGYSAREFSDHSPALLTPVRWPVGLSPLPVGLTITGLLMLGEWGFGLMAVPWYRWVSFILASVVQFGCGSGFYSGAWRQLRVGASNMDTLVALGSTTAYGFSAWILLSGQGGHLYFMEAAAIISVIAGGHALEARVSDQAGQTLRQMLSLAPNTARKLVSTAPPASTSGRFNLRTQFTASSAPLTRTEVETSVASLIPGDMIALHPGDRVPVDGLVVAGSADVDESMLTGEAIPSAKKSGDPLFAGTINLDGQLTLKVTATGEQTALAHIIATVQRAQTSRANIQRLGDRISNVFVPLIVCVALGAGLWWGLAPESAQQVHAWLTPWLWHSHSVGAVAGFVVAAAVLIVACPCAMGLATPAALMAAANTAVRHGLLIRDAIALEKAGEITCLLFDKTGTLTVGKPQLVGEWDAAPYPVAARRWAASLASRSQHPVSQALARLVGELHNLANWREIGGCGVEADGWRLGSLRWLDENGVGLTPAEAFISQQTAAGRTLVGLAQGTRLAGLFALRDQLKPGARAVVEQLRANGLQLGLVTGDHPDTAYAIAAELGIARENVRANARPEDKAAFIRQQQERGERVAFVGDGINDAPALTQADLGIAVSRASDIAREAADLILLNTGLESVPSALRLARQTLRIIRQNLFWAFAYNLLAIPLAALGFISPWVCAVAMGGSDLIVIGNALRLLRWRPNSGVLVGAKRSDER